MQKSLVYSVVLSCFSIIIFMVFWVSFVVPLVLEKANRRSHPGQRDPTGTPRGGEGSGSSSSGMTKWGQEVPWFVNPVSSILQSWAAESELTVAIVTLAIQRSEEGQALGRSPGTGSKRGSVGFSMAASTCQTCKRCCRRKQ